MKFLYWLALALVVVGAVNWGLVGIFGFDLVKYLFVELLGVELVATIVYIVVGVAGLYLLGASCCHCCKCCKDDKGGDECCGGKCKC
ncbi:MAG: DUF378 domain-containing protein [Candidatus Gracilibacteria bacterium]|jgi:hypothetical protein